MEQRSPWQVVGVTPATKSAFEALDDLVWFDEGDPDDDDPSGALDLSRCFGASATGEPPFAGVYGWFDQTLTVPGPDGPAPARCAGLTWVGVHPDDRRRGVLTAMLGHHLADVHDRGHPLAALHASEPTIYGRYGYAQASLGIAAEVGGGTEVSAPPGLDVSGVRTVLLDGRDPATVERVVRIQHAAAATRVGQVTLTPEHHARRLRRDPAAERESEPLRVLVASRDGVDLGYAFVRRKHRWTDSLPQGTLTCDDLTAEDPAARFALLRRLVSFDLIGTVTMPLTSVQDEVVWWLGGPRSVKARVHDALWLRVVDVPAALALRGYAADVDVVLEVEDDRCPWNAGRWRVTARGGSATCERTEDSADVRLPVQALGSVYLGGRPLSALVREGVVTEATPGMAAAFSRALATDLPPSGALQF